MIVSIIAGLIPVTVAAEALPSLSMLNLVYRMSKANAADDLKTQFDDVDTRLQEARQQGRTGEVRRQLARGMSLANAGKWSDLQDFDASLQWLQSGNHTRDSVEQAILGVVGGLDKPASPAGEAKQHFHNVLQGRSDALRTQFRQRVLEVTQDDLLRVADAWLQPGQENTAILSSPSSTEELSAWIEQYAVEIKQL